MSVTSKFSMSELVQVTNFILNTPNLPKKGFYSEKQDKWLFPSNSAYLNYSRYQLGTNLIQTVLIFFNQLCPKKIFPIQNRINEHYHHIQISLGTNFYLKVTAQILWIKTKQKTYFRSKTEQMNITIKFSIFELGGELSFIIIRQFFLFGPNLVQKVKLGPRLIQIC